MLSSRSLLRILSTLFFLTTLVTAVSAGAQIFVKADATGANNGSSWADAFSDLQDGLAVATSGEEIWVAAGTYTPTSGTDRLATFQIISGVALYGGFAGTETLLGERDIAANPTILSGEIGAPGNSDNSNAVVTGSGTDATAVLDGFTVTAGNAPENGGGLNAFVGSPTVRNVIFTGNESQNRGGAMHFFNSSPILMNVIVEGNSAAFTGGGMHNSESTVSLTNVTFENNTSAAGGGVYQDQGHLSLTDVTSEANSATQGGAFYFHRIESATIVNSVFVGNTAGNGGAILDTNGGSPGNTATILLVNVTMFGNSATFQGGAMRITRHASVSIVNSTFVGNSSFHGGALYNLDMATSLINTILWDNFAATGPQIFFTVTPPVVTHSLIEGSGGSGPGWNTSIGTDGGNNIDADPLFVDPGVPDRRLSTGSSAIDTGDNTATGIPATDIAGNPRIVNGTVDMGAYEFACAPGTVVYVDADAVGAASGASWTNAYPTLVEGLAVACGNATEIWVAEGSYTPTAGLDRYATFRLRDGLALYGGFNGTETSPGEADPAAHPTALTGDIGVVGVSDNSFHVLTGGGTGATAVIDGFIVRDGNAGGVAPHDKGGGMLNSAGSPTLRRIAFEDNIALTGGGTCNTNGSSPVLIDVTFTNNTSFGSGGGMHNDGSGPVMTNVVFAGNTAITGGGVYNFMSGSTSMTNAVFYGNSAVQLGGAMVNSLSDVSVTNGTFGGNAAATGGAVYNTISNMSITNSILFANTATLGKEIHNISGSSPVISYSLIQDSGASGAGWDPALGIDGGSNIDADPLFVNLPGGDLHVDGASPAIDAGDNNAPNLAPTDLDGNPRIIGVAVDMGAYETDAATAIPGGNVSRYETAIRSVSPNPFNPTVTTVVELDRARRVRLAIYDVQGVLVRELLNEVRDAGVHTVTWNATDNNGNVVASGVYFLRLESAGRVAHRKLIFLK